jgi:hypothetical protein
MCSIIAVSGRKKVTLFTGLSNRAAAYMRRELVALEDNFDMLGNTICTYRLKGRNK